jgi:ferric-dicitrate binding protein FerR (iron transport regulator)
VRLLRGEALFRVQHEPGRAFRVHSGAAIIEAVGTEFNVLHRQSDSMLSVIEGRVRVDRERTALQAGGEETIPSATPGSANHHGAREAGPVFVMPGRKQPSRAMGMSPVSRQRTLRALLCGDRDGWSS